MNTASKIRSGNSMKLIALNSLSPKKTNQGALQASAKARCTGGKNPAKPWANSARKGSKAQGKSQTT
jgi:hypothetical protein